MYVLDTGGFAPIYEAIQPLIYDKTAERRKQFTVVQDTLNIFTFTKIKFEPHTFWEMVDHYK